MGKGLPRAFKLRRKLVSNKVSGAVNVGVTLDVAGSSKKLESFEDDTKDVVESTINDPVHVLQNPSMKNKLPKKGS